MNSKSTIIGTLLFSGGPKNELHFSVIEHYDNGRSFLVHLKRLKYQSVLSSKENWKRWLEKYNFNLIILDIPLNLPKCFDCNLDCPGLSHCPVSFVAESKEYMLKLLEKDNLMQQKDPHAYRAACNERDKWSWGRTQNNAPLSKSLKRKLQKGILPFWNRSIDPWIWTNYHDDDLRYFSSTYHSFGRNSEHFDFINVYLKKHMPPNITFYETDVKITLIELLKASIIDHHTLRGLGERQPIKHKQLVLKNVEKNLDFFFYNLEHDYLLEDRYAFKSFLLGLNGITQVRKKNKKLPEWATQGAPHFIIPDFNALLSAS